MAALMSIVLRNYGKGKDLMLSYCYKICVRLSDCPCLPAGVKFVVLWSILPLIPFSVFVTLFVLFNHSLLFLATSANRLLFSNPCFAPLRQGLLKSKVNGNQTGAAALAVKPFSLSAVRQSLPEGDCKSGDNYAKLWTIERGVAIALLPLVPAAFYFTSPAMDYLVAFTFTLHAHWWFQFSNHYMWLFNYIYYKFISGVSKQA